MDSKVVEISGVSVELGGVEILHDIDLVLHRGELIWLSGFNGAGKSTLLRALAGLLPYKGKILICGHEPRDIGGRSSFVFVPDRAALYEDLTLEEHVHFTSMVYEQEDAEGRMLRWLDRFNLTDRLGEFPVTHSRGMQQKLSLALALGLDLPYLMLDEPYDGLDEKAQPLLSEALQERVSSGGAVLFTTHQAHHAVPIGSRELILEEGRLLPPADRGSASK